MLAAAAGLRYGSAHATGELHLRFTVFLLIVCAVLVPARSSAQTAAAPPTYTVGIVPQQSSTVLVRAWAPVLKYLSDKTGYRLVFATAKDIPTFEQRLAKGDYDFGYMSPYTYTVLHRSAAGYTAFAKEKDKKLTGIIVVQRRSPFSDLQDLGGKTIAFPAASAIAATLIPRAHFDSRGIPVTPVYVSSHESVYLAVAKGIHPAGGGVMRTFNTLAEPVREKLRVLWTTPSYTPHPFAAHKRVPAAAVQRLRDAMIGMNRDPAAKPLLDRLAFLGIVPADDAEYDDIRALKLTVSDHLLE